MRRLYVLIAVGIIILLVVIGGYQMILFGENKEKIINSLKKGVDKSIIVTTSSFNENDYIPSKYTCDGVDISPALSWSGIPANTKSIMIVMYDPDAPSDYFIHWVIYNIPPQITSLPEGESGGERRSSIGVEARNDFGRYGYGGPCPPHGKPHRYYFLVLALDTFLNVDPKTKTTDILKKARGHILAYGELMGKYGR